MFFFFIPGGCLVFGLTAALFIGLFLLNPVLGLLALGLFIWLCWVVAKHVWKQEVDVD